MLPKYLKQIFDQLETRSKTGVISDDETALLNELKSLNEQEIIIETIAPPSDRLSRSIAPASGQCPCCGRPLS